jgi:hypothetical protein
MKALDNIRAGIIVLPPMRFCIMNQKPEVRFTRFHFFTKPAEGYQHYFFSPWQPND